MSTRMHRLTRSEAVQRDITQKDRPSTETILAALSNILALYEQGLIVHKVTLSESGHRHVGETFADAQTVLSQSRWRERGPA